MDVDLPHRRCVVHDRLVDLWCRLRLLAHLVREGSRTQPRIDGRIDGRVVIAGKVAARNIFRILTSASPSVSTDRYDDITDDDELEGRPGWQRVFVVVCIGYYTMACVLSVFIMFGLFDYLKQRPDTYSSAASDRATL